MGQVTSNVSTAQLKCALTFVTSLLSTLNDDAVTMSLAVIRAFLNVRKWAWDLVYVEAVPQLPPSIYRTSLLTTLDALP